MRVPSDLTYTKKSEKKQRKKEDWTRGDTVAQKSIASTPFTTRNKTRQMGERVVESV